MVGKAGFEPATSASRTLLQAFLTDGRCLVSLVRIWGLTCSDVGQLWLALIGESESPAAPPRPRVSEECGTGHPVAYAGSRIDNLCSASVSGLG